MCYIDFQKRDGASILTSSEGDKSSLTKSTAPSTPIGESVNFHAEPRISNSLAGENVSADLFSIGHGEFPSGSIHGEEIPLVRLLFLIKTNIIRLYMAFQNKNCHLISLLQKKRLSEVQFCLGEADSGDFSITVLYVGHICQDDNFTTTLVAVCPLLADPSFCRYCTALGVYA